MSRKNILSGLVAVGLGLSIGCSNLMQLDFRGALYDVGDFFTPQPGNPELDAIRKKEYPHWPRPIREAVDQRQIIIGMTKPQVVLASRIEEVLVRKQVMDTKDGAVEIWTLWKTPKGWAFTKVQPSRAFSIRFQQGKVVDLQPN